MGLIGVGKKTLGGLRSDLQSTLEKVDNVMSKLSEEEMKLQGSIRFVK